VSGVVVVGTGQAAAQLAMSLRQRGYDGPVTLVGEEPHLPYERPPLSKAYLAGKVEPESLSLRPASFWQAKQVDVRTGVAVERIEREHCRIVLADGTRLEYEHLVLATGAEARRLDVPGAALAGVHLLRTQDDADRLRAALAAARHVVVVGAGFIGLEVAAVAREAGAGVTVLEGLDRAMARVVSPTTAAAVVAEHRARGVDVRFETGMAGARGDERGWVRAVITTAGDRLPCDVLVMGVGVSPRTELAAASGLPCVNGVLVDECLRTEDPAISAIGDCAAFPSPFADGKVVRLEAVQNAADQARCVAERLTGAPVSYGKVPWFWTTQYGLKLQVAGLVGGHDRAVVRGDPQSGAFSVFCFDSDRLLGVESLNRPADHVLARALLAGDPGLTPELVADPDTDLKAYKPARRDVDTAARARPTTPPVPAESMSTDRRTN
jgi:3-phenylpropionate/trans-cinnamate dioxygenase ferredoxin reductase subunit